MTWIAGHMRGPFDRAGLVIGGNGYADLGIGDMVRAVAREHDRVVGRAAARRRGQDRNDRHASCFRDGNRLHQFRRSASATRKAKGSRKSYSCKSWDDA